MPVGNYYELQKMYDQIISVHKLSYILFVLYFIYFISYIIYNFESIRQRTMKVLMELRKMHRFCLFILDNDVKGRGDFINFFSESFTDTYTHLVPV